MNTLSRTHCAKSLLLLAIAGTFSAPAFAANVNIDWLTMAPVPFNTSVPNGSVFNLAGVGNVTVTYSLPGGFFTDARLQNPLLIAGNVVSGPDTYSWTDHEMFAATNLVPSDPVVQVPWRITFTFPGTVAANEIYVGVAGLGRTDSFGGGATVAHVQQNGTFLGDWTGGGNYGATNFTSNPGNFTMYNSVSGAGGADPWWNSALGVVQVNDAVSSITVDFGHIAGDGAGVNIGYAAVPAPGALALLGLGGLLGTRRQRL